MLISGVQKLTLLDYPEKTACTIFTHGCNFLCPFCHNAPLVTEKAGSLISEAEILSLLKKRRGILDGVCITGGEPTLQKDLIPFMKKIKELGYLLKLDTNGYRPEALSEIFDLGLCDYVAMDVKNSPEKYSLTAGKDIDTDKILSSIQMIRDRAPDYEFRTTVVSELHDEADLEAICRIVGKQSKLFMQQFKDSGCLIKSGLNPWEESRLATAVGHLRGEGYDISLRG